MEDQKDVYTEKTPLLQERQIETDPFRQFVQSFKELAKSPRDIWLLYAYEILAYGSLGMVNLSLSIYFTEVLKFSDVTTGFLIAGFGVSTIISSICFGNFIDRHGIRRSLLLSNISAFTTFILLIFLENAYIQILILYTTCSIALAINIPTTKLAVKTYTLETARSIGYSFFFMALFAGSALGGVVVDFVLTLGDTNMATFKIIFIIGAAEFLFATIIALNLRELDYQDSGEREIELHQLNKTGWEHTKESLSLKCFWRFLLLTSLLVFVKAVYGHIFITLPVYMYREIGDGAHFGYMLAIHKLIMIIAIPLCTFLIYYFNFYSLLAIGSLFSVLAFIPFMFGGSYTTVILFICVVSIGEAIYAPRLIDYTLQVAPKGREGIFLAVAASPLVLSVIIAGLTAGFLLDNYCPEDGDRECWKMWGIVAIMTAAVPILMVLFRKYLEQPQYEAQPYMPCAKSSNKNN